MWHKEFTEELNNQFLILKKRNPKYSLRAFSKKIGLSFGALSVVLKGEHSWKLSPERAAKILNRLESRPRVRNRILVKMGLPPVHQKEKLPASEHEILLDWTYYPILFSFDLPTPFREPRAIAKRLGLEESKVKEVISDLLRKNHLVRLEDGTIDRPEVFLAVGDGPPSEIIRKHHEESLKLAARALEMPIAKRDFTSLTFAGSEKKINFLRQEIRQLYEKASSLTDENGANDKVFRLSVQLYPMEFPKT